MGGPREEQIALVAIWTGMNIATLDSRARTRVTRCATSFCQSCARHRADRAVRGVRSPPALPASPSERIPRQKPVSARVAGASHLHAIVVLLNMYDQQG